MQKRFNSDRFALDIIFHPGGGLSGTLRQVKTFNEITCKLSGLYGQGKENIIVAFMTTFRHPVQAPVLMAFSGEIVEYERGDECLFGRWIVGSIDSTKEKIETDFELLFNSGAGGEREALRKLQSYLKRFSAKLSFID
jgi:hypothetical protein